MGILSLEERILKILNQHGASARDYISFILKVPRTTVYDQLAKLEKAGKVEKSTYNNGKRGRSITIWGVLNAS